jgi:hypothetical protein
MYTRISKSGGRSYLQLVEGHRDAEGKVRIKVVANLGRLDRLLPDKLDSLINGLNRAVGRLENTAHEISHDPAPEDQSNRPASFKTSLGKTQQGKHENQERGIPRDSVKGNPLVL